VRKLFCEKKEYFIFQQIHQKSSKILFLFFVPLFRKNDHRAQVIDCTVVKIRIKQKCFLARADKLALCSVQILGAHLGSLMGFD
jgi:hypothetical protein